MKRLILMRHAKSAWNTDAKTDHERPLNARGIKDAPRIAGAIAERGWQPQLVLSSDSKRTQETWRRMEKAFDKFPLVTFLPSLYHSGIGDIQEAIEFIHPDTQTILILGHNPGWSNACGWLSGTYIEMKTATAILMTSPEESWQKAIQTPSSWNIEHILHPKEL